MNDRRCCWPGCDKMVPRSMWGCRPHWFALPMRIRNLIWAAYRRGQEDDGDLSPQYAEAFRQARAFALDVNAAEAAAGEARPKQRSFLR